MHTPTEIGDPDVSEAVMLLVHAKSHWRASLHRGCYCVAHGAPVDRLLRVPA